MTSSSLGLSCRIHSKGKSDDHYSQRRYDKPGKVPGFRALMPRSLSSKRNWTAEGSPAASGQVSGQGRGQAAPRLTSDDARDEAPAGACLVDGMWSAPGRDEEKAGVEDGDDCE